MNLQAPQRIEKYFDRDLACTQRLQRYGQALDYVSVGVIVVSAKGVIRDFNPMAEKLFGLKFFQVQGRQFNEVMRRVSADSDRLNFFAIRSMGLSDPFEVSIHPEPNRRLHLKVSVAPMPDRFPQARGYVLTLQDHSHLRRAAAINQRHRGMSMLSDVAARFAHEIRNPLGSIALFASSIADDPDVRPEIKALAEYISTGVDSINAIVENLIIAVKPGESPDYKMIDLQETLEDSLLFAGHLLAANKSVCIKTHWDAVPLRVWGDAQLLKQVMLNLILNAIQAMPEGGEISITCRRITEEDSGRRLAEIRVSDTGVGIAEEDLVRVFDPYFTTKDGGTGLGMAIVHNIISAHHGVIDIVSEHHRGAECVIHLPLAAEGELERLAQPMAGLRTRNAEGQRS